MADDDAAERGRKDDGNAERPNAVPESRAERGGTSRVLQNEGTLQIA
jgi:hypothetical protein